MFKTKRRKELEAKENELFQLKAQIDEIKVWCVADSPEIGFAMLRLQKKTIHFDTSGFREDLRKGLFTFDNYKEVN